MSNTDIAKLLDELRNSAPPPDMEDDDDAPIWKGAARKKKQKYSADKIALLDFETEPFDKTKPDVEIVPFVVNLYSDDFDEVIWDENFNRLIDKIFAFIEALPECYVFYAHNGGRFDYRFLEHKLRGKVNYKGSSLMRAEVGKCEIRDSLHILPIRLKEYDKKKFDYEKMRKGERHKHRADIIDYVRSDCRRTLELIKKFVARHGFKISVGAAALAKLKEHYKIEAVTPWMDEQLRPYFRGGRVECLAGLGYFEGDYLYLDVNSMYPDVMANVEHPIGSQYAFRTGKPNKNTFFLTLECDNNGALLTYNEETHELTSDVRHGVFKTTIHEYNMALQLGLIENVKIIECVDNYNVTNFSKFVVPRYADRQETKHILKDMKDRGLGESQEFLDVHGDDLLIKFELNNAYGKTAQNPRKFKQYSYTDPGKYPEDDTANSSNLSGGWELKIENADYWVWCKPSADNKFLNVGTGASITGAARAKLMHAIHYAVNPLYCDTDSLVCEDLPGFEMDEEKLGAWKIEARVKKMIVAGKKLYAFENDKGEKKYRSKGTGNWTWDEMLQLLVGESVIKVSEGPTLKRGGGQVYISRSVRATAKVKFPIERKA